MPSSTNQSPRGGIAERLREEMDGLWSAELGGFALPVGPAVNVMLDAADLLDEYRGTIEHLRHVLRVARPYISDRAGAGIIGAIDAALSDAKLRSRGE